MASSHSLSFLSLSALSEGRINGLPRQSMIMPTVPPSSVVLTDLPLPSPISKPLAGDTVTDLVSPRPTGMTRICPTRTLSSMPSPEIVMHGSPSLPRPTAEMQ